jgi:hypothetical protein
MIVGVIVGIFKGVIMVQETKGVLSHKVKPSKILNTAEQRRTDSVFMSPG